MSDTVFTKIIKGEIPSYKIYEDEYTFAFLDIHPHQPGHTLVVPKKPVEFVWDLEEADYFALMASVQKVARRIREVLQTPYVGEIISGLDIPHTHIHLIPFSRSEEFPSTKPSDNPPTHDELVEMAKKLAF